LRLNIPIPDILERPPGSQFQGFQKQYVVFHLGSS